jgi:hypothetical protein
VDHLRSGWLKQKQECDMSESKPSVFQSRLLILSILIGAVISGAGVIAFINSGRDLSFVANIVVSTISLAALPGYILTALITGNIHDANLVLAAFINCILYSAVTLHLMIRKNRN